jgi:RHS repeat-associated protein
MTGQMFSRAWVPLPGGGTAVYDYSVSNGLYFYRHPDWLGSSRVTSTPSRAFAETQAYMPFGETYFVDGSGDVAFTGQNSNNVAGLFDFPAREYSSVQGRWLSPDPAGLAAVDASDPQTWNRYAYVRNGPLNTTDPSGLHDTPDECFFDPFCNLTTWGFPVPTPSSFLPNPTPPIDWQTILFGPFNPSLLIFNWTACYNANGKLVSCSDPSAVIYCSDAASPDEAPAQQPSGACNNSIPQYAIGRHRFPTNNGTQESPTFKQQYNQCVQGAGTTLKVADTLGVWGLGSLAVTAGSSAFTSTMQWIHGTSATNIASTVAQQAPNTAADAGILGNMGEHELFLEGTWATAGKISLWVTAGATAISGGVRGYCAAKAAS